MVCLRLMFSLITSVCLFVVKPSPAFQTEENDSVIIRLNIQAKADISLTNLICYSQSESPKVLYEMIKGVEVPESQHAQFAGRVQLDKDALREGRVIFNLSTVTAEDSGDYRCNLAAGYDRRSGSWELKTSDQFVLKVNQVSDGNVSLGKSTSGPKTEGLNYTQRNQLKENIVLGLFIGAQTTAVLIALVKPIGQSRPKKDQDCETVIVQPSEEDNIDPPHCSID